MDVEIVKQNGQSFRLSDYGVVQDFVVHSIDRAVVRDPIDGRSGLQDYGVEVGDRTIEVPMIFKAADLHDYAHLRDELYGLLDDSEPFYIREMRRPKSLQYDFVDFGQKPKWEAQTDNEYVNGKQYLVRLNSTLTPEQRSLSGEVSIEFVTSGIPYAESIYTTLELHDSGYSATAEKYGLVDNIDDEKVQYRFNKNLMSAPYDYRSRLDSPFEIILSGGLPTGDYTISFDYEVLSGNPSGFLVFAVGTLTTVTPTGGRVSANFSIDSGKQNTSIRLYGDTGAASSRSTDVLFKNIKIERGNRATPFISESDYQPNLIPLTESAWEVGNWYTTNGTAGNQTGNIRTKSGQIPLVKGEKYTMKDISVYASSVRAIFILHYNNGEYIGSSGGWEVVNRGGSTTFTAKGNEVRISLAPLESFSVLLYFITNGRVQLKLESGEEHTGFIPGSSRFSIYNAGNVTVEPESMQIKFNFTYVYTTGGFTIRNLTTKEEVILNRTSNGSHFRMDGMTFSLGAINNVFRDTNRRFLSLSPGDNQFEIVGGTFSQCWFDFKYYYK